MKPEWLDAFKLDNESVARLGRGGSAPVEGRRPGALDRGRGLHLRSSHILALAGVVVTRGEGAVPGE